jgi:HTH-type transcriptional regulator, sugar sensing transcriptional regulator
VALDITLLSQRQKLDVEATMARMLGPRVGRLDTLLSGAAPRARRA